MKRTPTRRALRRSILAVLSAFLWPAIAGAEPCELGGKLLVCQDVEVRGKLWLDGDESKVKCKTGSTTLLVGGNRVVVSAGDPGESCQAFVAHAMHADPDGPDGPRHIIAEAVSPPEQTTRAGKPRRECLLQATHGAEETPAADGLYSASVHGFWKLDAKTELPKVVKAALATQTVRDATGIARFMGTLQAKDCAVERPQD